MDGAINILKILNKNNYQSYLVGGCVRDKLMGVKHDDIDIATPALPNAVMELFRKYPEYKCIPTGIEHGTITVVDTTTKTHYEISTFRKDTQCDGRHAEVEFTTDLVTDLSRRDLTVNSLSYDPIDDAYFDIAGGIEDINRKTIRCVGDADTRFKEDNLRMLRALRFEATLGEHWVIDIDTRNAIAKNAHLIKNMSKERIKMELDKCFAKADNPAIMLNQMRETGLLKFILPELNECFGFAQNKYHKHDVYTHTLIALDAVPKG